MDGLHSQLAELYESLADREIVAARANINSMIKELREILSTM
jgi:hypothetical protein